jgi:hypothetical protein
LGTKSNGWVIFAHSSTAGVRSSSSIVIFVHLVYFISCCVGCSLDSGRRMVFSGMLGHVALVRTDVSEGRSASFIRMTRIGELGITLAVTSNRRRLRRNTKYLQEPHDVTSQETPFFIV